MSQARGLTLEDLLDEGAAVSSAAAKASLAAPGAKPRALSEEDIFGKKPEKPEEPFEGGSTLKVTVPLPGDWPTADTGIPISKAVAQGLAGAGKRFSDVQNRAKQGLNFISGGSQFPTIQQDIDHAAERDMPLMATTPGMIGYAVPDIIATSAVAVPSTTTAAIWGGVQGLVPPVTSEDRNGSATNTALGILGGGGGNIVATGATGAVGKLAHMVPAVIPDSLHNWASARGITLPKPKWVDPETRRLYDLAKSYDVPTTIGDLDPTSSWANIENSNRSFWTGRRADMQAQQDATRRVINNLKDKLSSANPGSDGANIAEGVKNQYKSNKEEASALFDNVSAIAGRTPNLQPIKPIQAHDAARAALADYPELFDAFKNNGQVRKLLGLANDTGPQPGLIIDPNTATDIEKMTPFRYDQELGFDDARWLRKRLGAWYTNLNNQLKHGSTGSLDGEAVRHAGEVFAAFNRDIDSWGRQPGQKPLNDAWIAARNYFKDNVLPYRSPNMLNSKSNLIRDIVNNEVDTATIADKALPTRETSISKDIMERSDPTGKAAMKSALIHKMTDRATSPDLQGLGNSGLLRDTANQEHAGDIVFSPAERQAVKDTRDIARLVRRSAEAGTTPPPTGARTLPFMAGTTAAASIPAAYYGLGLLGDNIDPSTRIGLSLAAPLGVLGAMRGANNYARSALGKNFHFAEPKLGGALGSLQEAARRGIRGAGEPWLNEYTKGSLGHRED